MGASELMDGDGGWESWEGLGVGNGHSGGVVVNSW